MGRLGKLVVHVAASNCGVGFVQVRSTSKGDRTMDSRLVVSESWTGTAWGIKDSWVGSDSRLVHTQVSGNYPDDCVPPGERGGREFRESESWGVQTIEFVTELLTICVEVATASSQLASVFPRWFLRVPFSLYCWGSSFPTRPDHVWVVGLKFELRLRFWLYKVQQISQAHACWERVRTVA